MDTEYIRNLRYKLQKRVRRVNSSNDHVFHYVLQQFWGFLQDSPIFLGIMEQLDVRFPEIEKTVNSLFSSGQILKCDNELENVAVCYFVLKRCVSSQDEYIEIMLAQKYSDGSKHNDPLESFKEIFVEPFYDYLDEHIDDKSIVLSILRRYKQRCEWFQRNELYSLWEQDTQRGEKNLAMHLYKYLHDQGIDFFIEPVSASGEADLVSLQTGEEPLIADAKIFAPAKGKGKLYIAKGFRQLYSYTVDYNEPFGYLVIFKMCEEDLKFSLPEKALKVPFIIHNNRTIFFITIDLFQYTQSASKRGKLKTTEIAEADLMQVI